MIKGLPQACTEKEVREAFEGFRLSNGTYPSIYRVNFAYHILEYVQTLRAKNRIVKRLYREGLS
jgi:Cytosolic domain of 10TM putative phosphate transporter